MDQENKTEILESPEQILLEISKGTGGRLEDTEETFFPSYSERIQAIELYNQMLKDKKIDEKIYENFEL